MPPVENIAVQARHTAQAIVAHGQLPICAKCNRSVESLVSTRDFLGNRFVFRVFCHGETEETVLTEFLLMQMGGQDGIQAGVAFRDKAALPAHEAH